MVQCGYTVAIKGCTKEYIYRYEYCNMSIIDEKVYFRWLKWYIDVILEFFKKLFKQMDDWYLYVL